jgi:hypothetical protein
LPNRETYAQQCLYDTIRRNETALAGHMLFTQVLNDDHEHDRALGLHHHLNYIRLLPLVMGVLAVYTNHGISEGMQVGINLASSLGVVVDYRTVGYR